MPRPLLALALVMCLPCGGGAPTTDGAYPNASLEITYQHPEVEPYTYTVTCQGDTARLEGADLDAERACQSLSDLEVASRLVDGPPDQACPEIYGGADVATFRGTIEGEEVDAMIDRTNGCGISDWDNLLDGLLPPARGGEGAG